MTGKQKYPTRYIVVGYLVFVMFAIGVVGIWITDNSIMELGVPRGFTLWAVLYAAIVRFDRKQDQP